MLLVVLQKLQDTLLRSLLVFKKRLLVSTNVTYSAVSLASLTEITKQLAAAAYIIVLGIQNNLVDSLGELLLPFFIDIGRDDNPVTVFASLNVSDIGSFLTWNEIQDTPFV